MGTKILSRLGTSQARSGAYAVLVALAAMADDRTGFAEATIADIADFCRVDTRTVYRHLAALKAAGELQIIPRARSGLPSLYRVMVGTSAYAAAASRESTPREVTAGYGI